ncbi:MAG: hypothetical protein BWX73_01737 [Lentisphaerae bacterium ADurb.Bin082]|nr:MAG: hypothetical protein BWX73_01737 [Lentisphaerae bacterium ADurb.Bin082]
MNKFIIGIGRISCFLLLLLARQAFAASHNLLRGDADVETEYRSMTYGTWSSFTLGNYDRMNFAWSSEQTFSGKRSLAMSKNGELSALEINDLAPGEYTFSFWAKCADAPVQAFIGATQFLRSTWTTRLNNRKMIALSKEWKQYYYTFTADGTHAYVPTYGIYSGEGTAYFDAFQLNAGNQPLPYTPTAECSLGLELPQRQGSVFLLDEPIRLQVRVLNNLDSKPKSVLIEVQDYTGTTIKTINQEVTFQESESSHFTLDLPSDRRGWFGITAHCADSSDFLSYVVVKEAEPLAKDSMPYAGLCSAQYFPEAAKRIGVRWLEQAVLWHYAESSPGKYDFNYLLNYDEAKALRDQGFALKAYFALQVPAFLQSAEEKKAMQDFNIAASRFLPEEQHDQKWRTFVREFLQRYQNDFDIFEIGGELDAANGLNNFYKNKYPNDIVANFAAGPVAERAARLIDIAAEEVRKVRPDVLIAAVRPSDVDSRYNYAFTEEILKRCQQKINIMGVDCYPQPRWIGPKLPSVGLETQLKKNEDNIAAVTRRHTGHDNIFVSEYGYFIEYRFINDPQYQIIQANRLARSLVYGKAIGLQSFFYFYAYSPANSLEAQRFSMSIWVLGNPLSSVAAFSAAGEVVENVRESEVIPISAKMNCMVFRHADQNAVAAIWSLDSEYKPFIRLANDQLQACDMMGNPLPLPNDGENLRFQLGEEPIYIWRKNNADDNYAALQKTLRELFIEEDIPVSIFFRPASATRLKAYLQNPSTSRDHSGYFSCIIDGQEKQIRFIIPKQETAIVDLPMVKSGQTLPLTVCFDGDYKPFRCDYQCPEIITIPETQPFPLTESMHEFEQAKPLVVQTRDHIMPVDHTTWNDADDLSMKLFWLHDNNFLYFCAKVTDDVHYNQYAGKNIWKGDCLQIGICPKTNFIGPVNSVGPDDFILSLALNKDNQGELVVHDQPENCNLAAQTEFLVQRNENTKETLYQIKIPLKALSPSLQTDRIFGFTAIVMEDDSGAGADHWMFLSPGLAGGRNPALFPLFILE